MEEDNREFIKKGCTVPGYNKSHFSHALNGIRSAGICFKYVNEISQPNRLTDQDLENEAFFIQKALRFIEELITVVDLRNATVGAELQNRKFGAKVE